MKENRTDFPQKKIQMYQQLQELPKDYKVVALVKMEKVRSSQILPLRKKMKEDVKFFNIKNKIALKTLEKVDVPGIKKMMENIKDQCMFMFTNISPFKLNILLSKNKIMLPAKGGDIASMDIVVTAKNTGIAPGPMLTEFKEAGIPTKIDQGTIWITKDTIPAKKGEVISEALAALLGKLDIKPVEAGISLHSALEEGTFYSHEELTIDVEKVREDLTKAHQEALSLSVEAGYVTPDNIQQILQKASQYARSLSIESGYLTDETKEQVLQKAHAQAKSVAKEAKDYTPA